MRHTLIALSGIACLLSACGAAETATDKAPATQTDLSANGAVGDSQRGRSLFVDKGCVICHAVNGVGGRAAPALDAAPGQNFTPVEFAARIWRGAPAMVELQSLELGYVIDLDAADLTDLASFVNDAAAQGELTAADVPAAIADSLLNEAFWETENWDEFLEEGQQGFGEPEDDADQEQAPDPN